MNFTQTFQVIVVGGGHAGTEAALASARMGIDTLLLTHNIDTLGQMSCNPAIGGIGKSHLVKEIDALGGVMARATDRAGIQFRVLNASKGPAVRATRAQADRALYKAAVRSQLELQPQLTLFQTGVEDLILHGDQVVGVTTQLGLTFRAQCVILTTGTFLAGVIHVGDQSLHGGRAGDPASVSLAHRLRELKLPTGRLKTGTPPRIDGKSVDFSVMTEQPGDTPIPVMSYTGSVADHPKQIPCHITYTNERTHQVIQQALHRSAMYSGMIEGVGPRYCPSIEDKIVRFKDKAAHQIFVEPEGLNTRELYPNGLSTSLPFDVQLAYIQTIKGFETAHITRPGYAIEYDYFDPRGLYASLETKAIKHLYFAGQINGTTGYEEAGAQGLLAGINAALRVQDKAPWTPRRDEAYLGVLVDDLITLGTNEPYRMFTSRAEYRLTLREDNADLRLTEIGRSLGLVDDHHYQSFVEKQQAIIKERQRLQDTWIQPNSVPAQKINTRLEKPISREYTLEDLLRRPGVNYSDVAYLKGQGVLEPLVAEQVEIQIKYKGYIERQQEDIEKLKKQENTRIPDDFDYSSISGLSNEIQQKLIQTQPKTLAQANRIPGMTPAAISLLLVYLKKRQKLKILEKTA